MSVEAIGWVASLRGLNVGDKAVLYALANRVNGASGRAYPSVATIAAEAGGTVPAVRRILRRLEALGLVETTRRRHGARETSASYRLRADLWPAGSDFSRAEGSSHGDAPRTEGSAEGVRPRTEGSAETAPDEPRVRGGGTEGSGGRTEGSPNRNLTVMEP